MVWPEAVNRILQGFRHLRLEGGACRRLTCALRIPRSRGTNRYGPSPRTRPRNTKWHHLDIAGRRPLTRKPLCGWSRPESVSERPGAGPRLLMGVRIRVPHSSDRWR